MTTFYHDASQRYYNDDVLIHLMVVIGCYLNPSSGNWVFPYSLELSKPNVYHARLNSGFETSSRAGMISTFFDYFFISRFYELNDPDPNSNHFEFILKSNLPDSFEINFSTDFLSIFEVEIKAPSFDTELYPELLDNEETKLSLQRWIDDGSPSWDTYSDKDIKAMELIEKYNKNVLLLRSTRKVEIDKEISFSSDSSSDVDLTPVVQQLSNINNKLQTTEIIDNTQKSITDVLNQQSNTIQVDEIGLLRSKKGYY